MIRRLLLFFVTVSVMASAQALNVDSILNVLDRSIDRRDYYYMVRETRIDSLKHRLLSPDLTVGARREAVNRLYEEYSKYQGDSAMRYALMLSQLPEQSPDDKVRANTALILVYVSSGLFNDAINTISATDLRGVSDDVKGDYYFMLIRAYSDMSNYVSSSFNDEYARLSKAYSDSVIAYKSPDSYQAHYANVFKTQQSLSQDEKIREFSQLLNREDLDISEKAMMAAVLADLYRDKDREAMIFYKALSANMDILSAKHETTAARDLALYLYEDGDVDRAARLIHLAHADAKFYNGRHRLTEIANILPLIEQKRYTDVSKQRNTLIFVSVIFALMAIALAIAVFYIIKQVRTAHRQRQEIEAQAKLIAKANEEIAQQNAELKNANQLLSESNKIKDEYIGFGFAISASYMDKIENLYKFVDRKLATEQYDELRKSLKKRDLREDKEAVLKEFDHMFLRLFPSFVKKYNALFPPEDEVNPGENTLTSEMRIFALIRLGISDSSKIAILLNYSVNTVNAYKTKAKNRSLVPNDQFESRIMDIKSVSA